jgi:tRNA U34 2-thiouridine synthase MnmA/TrmU
MKKAVALVSGGLDSMLAVKAILEQGIYVEAINFFVSKATPTLFVKKIKKSRNETMLYG